ncbi:MAG TPA: LuxR C-terminal-related transcriptional regulator [Dehalococcoidia bacterium]|nr:LuxR C-terminal-related transcriptional regulator [Dehalococcoidia bacterium]
MQPSTNGKGAASPRSASAAEGFLELLGASCDGVYAVDSNQRITYWSPSAERIMGFQESEVLGRLCYEFMMGEDYDGYPFCRRDCPTIVAARRGQGVPAYDIGSKTNFGAGIWVSMSIVPGGAKSSAAAIHLFRDITERRRSESLARQTLAAVRGFLDSSPDAGDNVTKPFPAPVPMLSPREVEVLRRLSQGDSTAELAGNLGISMATARNHLDRVMRKLGVHSRLQAVVRATRLGIV